MSAPRVAIIVLNYRGDQVLRPCLLSLGKAMSSGDTVLVVDNGGEEVLLSHMREEFSWIETISSGSNRGFAAGMNLGVQYLMARGAFDAFWLVNNDAQVDPNSLNELKRVFIEKGEHALYSPLIFSNPANAPWFSGGEIDFLRMRTKHRHDLPESQAPYKTGFLTGCALFIPRSVIEKTGFLDERYFLYYEDAEYSLRTLRKGLSLWVVPYSRIVHTEESRHNAAKTYWLVRSGAEFFLRESRGLWRIWIIVYLFLRRLKNSFAVRGTDQTVANEVKRAYTDISL